MDLLAAMRAYRRVVELRSFSAAARDLGASNAATSRQIAWLEERLGARLIERTTRRLAITPEGEAYYARCVRVLDDIDEAEQAVGRGATSAHGVLRLNAPLAFAQPELAEILCDFVRKHPGIELDVTLDDAFVDLVEEGVDLAIRITTHLSSASSLVAHKLARTRVVVVGAPKLLRKHGTPTSPSDLARFPCIEYSLSPFRGEWRFGDDERPTRVPIRGPLRVNKGEVQRHAALAGVGLAFLPRFYVEAELASGALREVLADVPRKSTFVHAVYPKQRHVPVRVRTFIDFLRQRLTRTSSFEALS